MGGKDTFTAKVPKVIKEHEFFEKWINNIDGTLLLRIMAAIAKIESEGLITDAKSLQNGLYEKKWNSGLRLYFAVIEENGKKTLLVLGSGKDREQQQAIEKSKKALEKFKVVTENIKYNPNKREEI